MIDSRRTAPLYRVMILRRARNTLHTTPRDARGPGFPRPKPRETVSPATAPHRLLPRDPSVHGEGAPRLRDEDVLERDLLRLDLLDRRAVPRDRLDDLRQEGAGVLDHHVELRAAGILRGHRDLADPGDGPEAVHGRGGGDTPPAHDALRAPE